jgi:hypothetical protein
MSNTSSVSVRIDPAGVDRLTKGASSGLYQALVRVGNRVLSNSKGRCPVDIGNLRSSGEMLDNASIPEVRVSYRAHYAIYVHEGTRYMAGRPYLRDALTEEMNRL